jgi:N-acetylmuramic acid 6-phosphate etherase
MRRMTTGAGTAFNQMFLGIEGGGTRTVALLADENERLLERREFGPANLKLLNDAQLVLHFRAISEAFPRPTALAIGLAGAREEKDWQRIRVAAARVWPGIPCHATNDLETALAAAASGRERGNRERRSQSAATVLVLSGTGSCCYGRATDGRVAKFGGWGHLLGDKGSGYEIGLRALKAVVYYFDRDGEWSELGQRVLRALQLNEPNELISWVQSAAKADIAVLAVEVFAAAARRDKIASDILAGAAHSLAKDAASCARRLVKAGAPVQFVLAGSVLLKQPRFAKQVALHLKLLWPKATISPLKRESAWGSVVLAKASAKPGGQASPTLQQKQAGAPSPAKPEKLSPTEMRHPDSMHLDELSLAAAITLMLREDGRIPSAILAERKKIERAVGLMVQAFRGGGRLFYVGAGSSGRLGVLDASECPPTFRTSPELVQGIMAGGQRALWTAVEGAEDDAAAGARALQFRGLTRHDVVVGIAASGRTPFVWGALAEARRRQAKTVLLCFNPFLKIPRNTRPDLVIAPNLGPEILTGSTRLKAGTATKLILNIFTTLAMVRLGKVRGNLMVDLNPSNVKLRDRAVRIVQELTGTDAATARLALEKHRWVVTAACDNIRHRPL